MEINDGTILSSVKLKKQKNKQESKQTEIMIWSEVTERDNTGIVDLTTDRVSFVSYLSTTYLLIYSLTRKFIQNFTHGIKTYNHHGRVGE